MTATPARLLSLLGLLQATRTWSGPELAERLAVTGRTIRQDITRLRDLGYAVDAVPGPGGGYRLAAGNLMPPLLLDDEESVALVLGLRAVADGSVRGVDEASHRALAKLDQVLPARLHPTVQALQSATATATSSRPDERADVDAEMLTTIATACRRHEGLRFDYRTSDGETSVRRADPQRLVYRGGRWYLIAFDADRVDWRTFRVDRLTLRSPGGPRFEPRDDPGGDAAAYLNAGLQALAHRCRATVRILAPLTSVAPWMRPEWGELEAADERSCLLHTTGDSYEMLAVGLGLMGEPFEVIDPPELTRHLRQIGQRLVAAADASPGHLTGEGEP